MAFFMIWGLLTCLCRSQAISGIIYQLIGLKDFFRWIDGLKPNKFLSGVTARLYDISVASESHNFTNYNKSRH